MSSTRTSQAWLVNNKLRPVGKISTADIISKLAFVILGMPQQRGDFVVSKKLHTSHTHI